MEEDDAENREGSIAVEGGNDRDALRGALVLARVRKWQLPVACDRWGVTGFGFLGLTLHRAGCPCAGSR
jgi:hypothetical protein